MKITAIHGGGDWYDASAEYLIIPPEINIKDEKEKRRQWYYNEYMPALQSEKMLKYISLYDWLINLGAREPTEDELVIEDDY